MQAHKHAAVIKAWADDPSIAIEWRDPNAVHAVDRDRWNPAQGCPHWRPEIEYRIKPAVIEPEYPASSISDAQLSEHWQTSFSTLRGVADAAVRYEFEVGNAITKAEHEAALMGQRPTLKELSSAVTTLDRLGYTYEGGELWKPPLGPKPSFLDVEHSLSIVNVGAISGSKQVIDYVANRLLDADPVKRYTTTELTLDQYRETLREETAARELAIAEAVARSVRNSAYITQIGLSGMKSVTWSAVDFPTIIASVP